MLKMENVGAQLYTLRDFCKTPKDLERTLKKVSQMGYRSIQVSGIGAITPEIVKQVSKENKLEIAVTHFALNDLLNRMDDMIHIHQIYECSYIGIGCMPEEYKGDEKGYLEFAKILNRLGEHLKKYGFTLVYHNHAFEFEKFNGRRGLDILIDETDKELVQFETDVYWIQTGGGNPVWYIENLKGRVDVVHLKDYGIENNTPVMAEIGNGNLNFIEIIKACNRAGVKHLLVEQDICKNDPFESLKMSYDYLNSLNWGELNS